MTAVNEAAVCTGWLHRVLLLLCLFSFQMVALHPHGSARTPPRCHAHRCRPRCRRCQTSRQSAAACGRCSTLQPGTTLALKSACLCDLTRSTLHTLPVAQDQEWSACWSNVRAMRCIRTSISQLKHSLLDFFLPMSSLSTVSSVQRTPCVEPLRQAEPASSVHTFDP
jgi:hypothetical protein